MLGSEQQVVAVDKVAHAQQQDDEAKDSPVKTLPRRELASCIEGAVEVVELPAVQSAERVANRTTDCDRSFRITATPQTRDRDEKR